MDYNLAKKLQKAGFPQDLERFPIVVKEPSEEFPPKFLLLPTLSELIEACGDKFFGLNRLDSQKWSCHFMEDENATGEPVYSTPEEAVAHLFLALKKGQFRS